MLGSIERFRGEYFFLSNMFPVRVVFEDLVYPSSEHAYQAAKTLKMEEREMIAGIEKGTEAKRIGSTLTLREDWDQIKVVVMRQLLMAKFSQHPLRERLLATGHRFLVEGNTWGDTFWGVCNREGQNTLGLLLMEAREQLLDNLRRH